MNIQLRPTGNGKGDIYTNNSGAYASGVSLPVLSNDVSAFVPTTLFGDTAWIDANANGIQDNNEVGVEGIPLELLDPDNGNAVLATTVTDKNGKYKFIDLTADKAYKVRATVPAFYAYSPKTQGTDTNKDSNVDATGISDSILLNFNQQNKSIDIGLTSSLSVTGKVYQDDNINQSFDVETVIANATLNLYKDVNQDGKLDTDDILVASVQSDASGDYRFTNVFAGDYVIEVNTTNNIPANYVFNGNNLPINVVDSNIINQNFPFIPLVRAYQSQGSCGVIGFSETFGAGIGRAPFPASVTSSYLYNDGSEVDPLLNYIQDGQYALLDKSTIASAGTWWIVDDDATGDLNGRMLMLNAVHNSGEYYRQSVTGLTVGKTYSFTTSIANPYSDGDDQDPNVKFSVVAGGSELASTITGLIPEDVGADEIKWQPYTLIFTATSTQVDLVLKDQAPNSGVMGGNDLVIDDITLAETCKDYGDAPTTNTSYGEAVHAIKAGLQLGAVAPDAESSYPASVDASGDDSNGDDEDAVSSFPKLTDLDAGISYEIDVKVTNTLASDANLIGWIDIDADGSFDADEASDITPVVTGSNNTTVKLTWPNIPADIAIADTFLRVRLTNEPITANDTATYFLNGEVEDYPFTIEVGGFPVKGRVYNDSNVDGINDASEAGIGQLAVVLVDLTQNTCISTKTDADGHYQFFPVIPGNYQLYESSRETVPIPENCDITKAKDPSGYRSTTGNVLAPFSVVDAEIIDKDFGDVANPTFSPDHSGTVLAGNAIFYRHTFTPKSTGTVSFSHVNSTPTTNGWSNILYQDVNCNGLLEAVEVSVMANNLPVSANSPLCLLNKVYAPSNVALGETFSNVIQADFDFNGNVIAGTSTLKVTDLSKTTTSQLAGSSRLDLRKTVENITQNTAETETQNQATSGDVLQYRIYYRNTGTASLDNLVINDTVPEFTLIKGAPICGTPLPPSLTGCTPSTNGDQIEWLFPSTDKLQSSSGGVVSYQVTIE